MRHPLLFPLFAPITRIKGVGGTTSEALSRLLPVSTTIAGAKIPIVRDLLFHLPVGLLDRRFTCALNAAPDGVIATFVVRVQSHQPPPAAARRFGKKPYKIICENDTGELALVFFNAREEYLKQMLPVGQVRVVSGRTEKFDYRLQMTHPDVITTVDKLAEVQKPEPVYPLTLGLTSRRVHKLVLDGLSTTAEFPEWIDPAQIAANSWPSWRSAVFAAHHPQTQEELLATSVARMRLAYDEMLAGQLHLALLRRNRYAQPGIVIKGVGDLTEPLLAALPYRLTKGQVDVLQEICADMASGHRMGRLLQGDVGSGKTIVALLAMLRVAEQGGQSALMVPTELIAQQHYDTISKLCQALPIKVDILTGRIKGKAREQVLQALRSGETRIIVGTHALFQEHVEFADLSLVVIDEQHRFGVNQRVALTSKGRAPHVLHMTATPIPRSLTLTLYGDMDCSQLREKPAQRKPIITRAIPISRYEEVLGRLQAALDRGEKAYWICPLIDEKGQDSLEFSQESDIAAAQTRYTEFCARFGEQSVALVHGQMKADQRDQAMQRFANGDARILVATTVVEVGVDVRDATIIVIEQAERFGLAQLHQLRGRVGRGHQQSACVLLFSDSLAENAVSRLSILRETEDGFRIAEADLAIRGGGEVLGTRQSGMQRFIFTDLYEHRELLEHARQDVDHILAADAGLAQPRGQALQLLLQLFSHEHA